MLIIPAIDLRDGRCVRLLQGKFDAETRYGDPIAQLQRFEEAGATWVHIVDLDGARAGRPAQHELISRLARGAGVSIQCGGGARTRTDVEALLAGGVARVVVGSVAVRKADDVRRWLDAFGPDRICIALDVRQVGGNWLVATEGWTADGGLSLDEALAQYAPGLLRHVLATDISRDGALTGPNLNLMRTMVTSRPDLALQASGGVSSLDDLAALRAAGANAAIVGRALYEARFSLEDALAL